MVDFSQMKVHELYSSYFHKTVKIYEMVHIAPQEFYDMRDKQFSEDVDNGYALQIEGMQIGERARPLHDSYRKIAKKIGYVMQSKPKISFTVSDVHLHNLSFIEKEKLFFMIKIVSALFSFADRNVSDVKMREVIDSLIEEPIPKSKLSFLTDELLLNKRNKIAVKAAINTPGNISMVWGKAHAEGLIHLFKVNGFVVV